MSKRNKFVDDHNVDHLLPLVGGVITKVIVDDGDESEETCYGIVVEKNGTKYECLIMCDPEGNGPGHLHIWKDK